MNNNSNNCGDCGTTCSECGRPWAICKQDGGCGCNKCKDIKFCEYGRMANGCIREKQPGCPMQAVIPSVTIESIEGIKNLADCLVHVSDINTTFYIDDKHRPIITWAGPVDIPGYDMESNPNNYRNQIVTDVANQEAVIYDKSGRGYVFGLVENIDLQDQINNKLDEMVNNGTFELLFAKYVDPYFENINSDITELENKVNALNTNAPTVVTDTSQMVDHEKIYVLTTDGNWYYWNGSTWAVGGSYDSDAVLSDIKWYLNDVATDGNSIYNPWNAFEGGLKTSDGSADTTSTSTVANYWTTDYIELPSPSLIAGYYRFLAFGLPTGNTISYYKVCVYDSNKDFVAINTSAKNRFEATSDTDITDYAYIRIQFAKSAIAFADRYKLIFTPSFGGLNKSNASRYTAVSETGIKAGSISANRLVDNLYEATVYNMLEQGLMPFVNSDVSFGTITSSEGLLNNNSARLAIDKQFKVPAGTTFELDNDWGMLVMQYDKNGTYLGRYTSDWTTATYFPVEMYVKLIFKNDVLGTINTDSSVTNLLTNISITKDSGMFSYTGDKVSLAKKYGAIATGLNMGGQDSAIASDGNIITFNTTGYYKVINISGQEMKAQTALDQQTTIAPHSNCVFFGTEKYDADDTYPIIYTNAYNTSGLPKGAFYAYRLKNDLTTTFLQTIKIGFTEEDIWTGGSSNVRPYGNFLMDTDNGKLYAYTMIDNLHVTRFFRFSMPELSDGATVTLQESDIEDYFDVPYFYYIQGGCYYNGKIYASCGFTSSDCKLYVVDLTEKKVTSTVPLGGFVGEPETVFAYKDELYVSSGAKLYKLKF